MGDGDVTSIPPTAGAISKLEGGRSAVSDELVVWELLSSPSVGRRRGIKSRQREIQFLEKGDLFVSRDINV